MCSHARRPSLHSQTTAASSRTSPARFLAAVQQCATASQMAVRCLAARSLAPLVPPADLAPTLQQLLTHAQTAASSNLNAVSCCSCLACHACYTLHQQCPWSEPSGSPSSLNAASFCACLACHNYNITDSIIGSATGSTQDSTAVLIVVFCCMLFWLCPPWLAFLS